MYVCLCRGITDRQIKQAMGEGARSMRELRQKLGVCSDCGKCGTSAKELLSEFQQNNVALLARPAV